MADISKIKLPNNVTYDLADDTARAALSTIPVTISASGWTDSTHGYWYNDVTISGITSSDNYEIVGFTPSLAIKDNATIKTQLGYITYGITVPDAIKFLAIGQVPTIDLPIILRRVL